MRFPLITFTIITSLNIEHARLTGNPLGSYSIKYTNNKPSSRTFLGERYLVAGGVIQLYAVQAGVVEIAPRGEQVELEHEALGHHWRLVLVLKRKQENGV